MDAVKTKKGINPALRNFFFFSIKAQGWYKEGKKQIGEIDTISIIITEQKTLMNCESATDKREREMSKEEKLNMMKMFKVKQETLDASKSIFVMLDMKTKRLHIQENKKDGTSKETTI